MMENLAFIIEDDADLAIIFSEAVKAAGFTTEVIQRGDVAQRRLQECVPRIVVLDLHLPYVSGIDLLSLIRGDMRFRETRIIIVTADDNQAEDLYDDADLTLLKPVSFAQLRDLARRLGGGG